LRGYDQGSGLETKYPKNGQEAKARRALAKVLRNHKPLHPYIRRWLALHFDDHNPFFERKLVFQFRQNRRPRGRKQMRDISVRRYMEEMIYPSDGARSSKVEAAVSAAMEKFKLSRRTVLSIWSGRKPLRIELV
jgi:hypothetical protein